MSIVRLPRPLPGQTWQEWANRLAGDVEKVLGAGASGMPYTLTNVTASRTLDPTAATTEEAAQVLATVITDLKTGGRLA